jgi:YVTN family beta-propeller protein
MAPGEVAIAPDSKTAYVTGEESDTVTPIRVATNTAGKTIKVGSSPSPSPSPGDRMAAR